jgi:hypothetical protein
MSLIAGNAKKYSGAPIDYVSIFDWVTGETIKTVIPDASGAWEYEYFKDMLIGITYVADGCKPISHGPYDFEADLSGGITSGYLLFAMAQGKAMNPSYDINSTTDEKWIENFSQTKDILFYEYAYGSGAKKTNKSTPPKIIDQFRPWWNLALRASNGSWYGDQGTFTFEIMDSENNVLFALKAERDGEFRSGLWYGTTLNSLTKTGQSGPYPNTSGVLSFTDDSVIFVANTSASMNLSFTFPVNLRSAVKVRVYGYAESNYTRGGGAQAWIKVLPPQPNQ